MLLEGAGGYGLAGVMEASSSWEQEVTWPPFTKWSNGRSDIGLLQQLQSSAADCWLVHPDVRVLQCPKDSYSLSTAQTLVLCRS